MVFSKVQYYAAFRYDTNVAVSVDMLNLAEKRMTGLSYQRDYK